MRVPVKVTFAGESDLRIKPLKSRKVTRALSPGRRPASLARRSCRREGGPGCPPSCMAGCAQCVYAPYAPWVHSGGPGSRGSRHVSTAEVLGHGPRADPVL